MKRMLAVLFLLPLTALADIWLSGQKVADANDPVVAGEWHGGFEKCLAEADRTHTPLVAVFVSEGDACTYCVGFRNAASTDEFKEWIGTAGCINLYMETAIDYTANGGNGYAFPDSDAWRWVSTSQQGKDACSLGAVKVYWNVDGNTCFSTNFVQYGSRNDTGTRVVKNAQAFISKCESFLDRCDDVVASNVILSNDIYQVIVREPCKYYVDYIEHVELRTNVWAIGVRDRNVSQIRIPRRVTHIGSRAFADMWDLDNVIIPDRVALIADCAFENCSWMQTITFGKGLKSIGKDAFKGCSQLQKVVFQKGLGEIDAGAFDGCWRLQSVSLPVTVTNVNETAFTGCSSLTGVTTPTHSGAMSEWFMPVYTQIKDVTIPCGETFVTANMFAGCSALENVTFADAHGVSSILPGGFKNCTKLAEVPLPESLCFVGDSAFMGCTSLASIVFPSNVTSIGESVLENCTALKDLTLSRSLTVIPDRAFYGCTALDSFTVPESVSHLGSQIVSGYSGWWSSSGTSAIYFLGNAPSYASDVYGASRSDLVSYIIYGTRGWDGRTMSRDIPQKWPTDVTDSRGILTWSPNPFDVTFDATDGLFENDGSTTYACQQITYTAYALPPYNPKRTGYLFDGWWTERSGGTQVTPSTRVTLTKAHTLYAHWNVAGDIRVRFNATGGTVSPEYGSFTAGGTYGELPVPTREYWDFDGWWTQTAGGTQIKAASEVPTADVELFAHWVPATYKIIFHAENGGYGSYYDTHTQTFKYGDTVTLWANTWTCGSATFGGWALEPGGKAVYADQKTLTDLSDIRDGELHLYAVWIGDTYAVRFDSNGGTGYMPDQTMVVGVSYNLNTNCFVRDGCTFKGWATTPTGSVKYDDGERVYGGFSSATKGATIVLYAVWKVPVMYTITFDAAGGTCSETQRSVASGAAIGELPTPVRSGYAFLNWGTRTWGGTTLTAESKIYASQTYYAVWERLTTRVRITFNSNGGENTTGVIIQTAGRIAKVPTPKDRDGYIFLGWFTAIEGGEELTTETEILSDITYYAHWRALYEPVTVTFNPQEGSVSESTRTVLSSKTVGSLPTPTRSKYKFDGWYTAATGGTKVTASTKVTADVTYYAHWTYDGSATVAVNVGSGCEGMGTVSGGKTAKAGTKLTLKATAAKGYVFAGWYLEDAIGTIASTCVSQAASYSYVVGEEDATLYAKFIPMSEDYANVTVDAKEEYTRGVAIEPIAIVVDSGSLATVKVTGLPSGLKFTTKLVTSKVTTGSGKDKVTTLVTNALPNTIYGTPMKSGVSTVTVTATTAGKVTATETFKMIVRADGEAVVDAEVVLTDAIGTIASTGAVPGKVTGMGICAKGKTLTLKAVANKGYVFAGWYGEDAIETIASTGEIASTRVIASDSVSRQTSYVLTAPGSDVTYYARFVAASDDGEITANVEDEYAVNGPWSLKLDIDSLSLPSVTVKGLPTGLKFDAKTLTISGTPTKPGVYTVTLSLKNATIKKAKTQTFVINVANIESPYLTGVSYAKDAYNYHGGVAVGWDIGSCATDGYKVSSVSGLPSGLKFNAKTGKIEGVPTKAGNYTATITLKNGKATSLATVTLNVAAIDPWAYGTFNGGSDNGQVQLSITSAGKLTGKYLADGITFTLAAPSFSDYDDDAYLADVTASWSYKENTKTVKKSEVWSISIEAGEVGGILTSDEFTAGQNVWSQTSWKTLGSSYFGKSGTVKTLTGEEYGLGEGESITMTIKSNGVVTLKGTFDTGSVKNDRPVSYTATGSAVVCVTSSDPFVGQVFIYFAPNANKNFNGYVRMITIGED